MLRRLLSLVAFVLLSPRCHGHSCWRNSTCDGPLEPSFNGPWESYIFAPSSRWVEPRNAFSLTDMTPLPKPEQITLTGNGSLLVLDFGIEVGGIVHLDWKANETGSLGLAFSEGKNWIGEWSDNSHAGPSDGAIYAPLDRGSGSYVMPDVVLRGGFRYLSLFLIGNGTVTVSNLILEISFQPTWSNLRAYHGYFYSDDDLLNKIWYSGAYTLQTATTASNTGQDSAAHPEYAWDNNGLLGNGSTILVDGAKRDRAVWPGDMGVELPSISVSIGEFESARNSLQTIYDHQNSDGSFPEAGPPLLQQGSDTYHMWSMIGTYSYVLYTNDTAWLSQVWDKYLRAMDYIDAKVSNTGLLNVTGTRDWARETQGGNNTEANMILYRTLITASSLAEWVGDTTGLSVAWLNKSASLHEAINMYCWDSAFGAFGDSAGVTDLHPQDANSMAILFGVTAPTSNQSQSISTYLPKNWNAIGAVSPELPENIVSFISSLEIQAHFTAGQTARGLELIRRSWGWYLNNPNGTQSTVIEGYLANGTFGYRFNKGYKDASYTSHSHGWSSGPTSALTEFVLGLSITGRLGSTWSLKPQFGDLNRVEGGFTTKMGKFSAGWVVSSWGYEVVVNTPGGTSGEVLLPAWSGSKSTVLVNGAVVEFVFEDGGLKTTLAGGSHKIVVT